MKNIGVYIHIPFCAGKCPYCDFYSRRGGGADYEAYTEAAVGAIESYPAEFNADTVYFGGGTPVLLGAKRLCRLLDAVKKRFGENQREITVEANPCAVDSDMLKALRKGGFDRISFGVQSLDDETLRLLGRRHTAAEAISAINAAHEAGFGHISADLMLAVPDQSVSEIERSIDALSLLPIDHLSAYMLKLEPQTAFYKRYAEPDEDFYAECYMAMIERCRENGFMQYEISNFARNEAAQSLHNLKYWRCREYLGIGPAAHSFIGGRRFYFPRELDSFIASPDKWSLAVSDGDGGSEEERLMLGLRLCEGIRLESFSQRFAENVKSHAAPLIKAGLMRESGGVLSLSERGFLVSNSIIAELI